MSSSKKTDTELLTLFKKGDKSAADELVGRYFERVVVAARKRISQRNLGGAGSEDIAASVFESLWKKADRQHFGEDDLTSSSEFWRLICSMVRFKTADHLRREQSQKRGGNKNLGETVPVDQLGVSGQGMLQKPDHGMSVDEMASFKEQHERLMNVLEDPTLQTIVTLRMEELKISEIAQRFDRSERWVKRKLALIREIWQEELQRDLD